MALPNKITPCPILEAVTEIRFEAKYPADAIYGIAYTEFKSDFPEDITLPIMQIPEAIRLQDQSLKFKPYYQLRNDHYILQIGPQVISLITRGAYNDVGWDGYSKAIKDCFERVKKIEIASNVHRLGIRYINFFEIDIFDKINLQVLMGKDPLKSKKVAMKASLETGKFLSDLQVSNNSETTKDGNILRGSIIDIDAKLEADSISIDDMISSLVDIGHDEEKKLFFELLKPDFLKTLNPE